MLPPPRCNPALGVREAHNMEPTALFSLGMLKMLGNSLQVHESTTAQETKRVRRSLAEEDARPRPALTHAAAIERF